MLLKACKTLRFDDEKLVEEFGKWDCFDYVFIDDSSIEPSETCTQTSIDNYMKAAVVEGHLV